MVERPHEHFMDLALDQARKAKAAGEVPVGAVIVNADGDVIGQGYNHPILALDPAAHAEIVAMREAALQVANYRLPGVTLYCTIEPCAMCAGAMIHARIERLVFGASDPKAGAAGSIYNLVTDPRLNHTIDVIRGIRDEESAKLLQEFFKSRRS